MGASGSPASSEHADVRRRTRLHKSYEDKDLFPWVPARDLQSCFLYWLPVETFPVSHARRMWMLEFMERFSTALKKEFSLRAELFLQFRTISNDASLSFRTYSQKCKTLLGLSRRPGAALPAFPTQDQIAEATKGSESSLDVSQWVGDYCHWFRNKRAKEQWELFSGLGGLTTLYLRPDPRTVPPPLPFTPAYRAAMPVFKVFDVDGSIEGAFALRDGFLEKSKKCFGVGLEQQPEYPAIMFIIPRLESGHFFTSGDEECAKWFEVFDVYINESPADHGILLAFREEYEPLLVDVLQSMLKDGLRYGEEPQSRYTQESTIR